MSIDLYIMNHRFTCRPLKATHIAIMLYGIQDGYAFLGLLMHRSRLSCWRGLTLEVMSKGRGVNPLTGTDCDIREHLRGGGGEGVEPLRSKGCEL